MLEIYNFLINYFWRKLNSAWLFFTVTSPTEILKLFPEERSERQILILHEWFIQNKFFANLVKERGNKILNLCCKNISLEKIASGQIIFQIGKFIEKSIFQKKRVGICLNFFFFLFPQCPISFPMFFFFFFFFIWY